jgi:aminopeptidase YwaD
MRKQLSFVLSVALSGLILSAVISAQAPTAKSVKPQIATHPQPKVCAACIQAHEEFLASDAMQGRGSGTHDELLAATYVASQLRAYGIDPAGDDGTYVQRAAITRHQLTAPPQLIVSAADGSHAATWIFGKEFLVSFLSKTKFSGPLQTLEADQFGEKLAPKITPGAVVLLSGGDRSKRRKVVSEAAAAGVVAVLLPSSTTGSAFEAAAKTLPQLPLQLAGESGSDLGSFNVLSLSPEAFKALSEMPEGASLQFDAPSTEEKAYTWNAVGILRGRDPALQHGAVLLSAHLDHLGIGEPVDGDNIYNGADDDASGTTAVLELARVLGAGPRPRRTVIFALFGSEEVGGLGSTFFREHPPVPLKEIAANLEFEMLGRPDSKVKSGTLWLTGWERSNLGPTLAAHGAKLVGDPHPDQNFFARSDNFVLAKKGVVAQTVSSYGLHADYHRPSDDLAHLDLAHMDAAIASTLGPVEWLVNSNFTPQWNPGGQP